MRSAVGLSIASRARAALATEAGTVEHDDRPVAVGLTEAGEVVVGDGALALAPPRRAITFVDEFGRPEPFIVAGAPYGAEALVAQVMRALVDSVTAKSGTADVIALAYADDLDAYRLDLIQQAARLAAVGEVSFVPESTARAYADEIALGAALWALDATRVAPAAGPAPTGTPVTARTALVGSGVVAAGASAATAGGAAEAAAGSAAAFGVGTSMADFGPSMGDFGVRRRGMKAFGVAAVVAAVVIGGAAAVLATRGGGGGSNDVSSREEVTTTSPEPDLDDVEAVSESLSGTFELVTTVIDGNPAFPVGDTTEFTLAVTSSCAGSSCVVEIENVGQLQLGAGGRLTLSGEQPEPCPNDPSITMTTKFDLSLAIEDFDAEGDVRRIRGTNRQETIDVAACPDTTSDPVITEWVMERADA